MLCYADVARRLAPTTVKITFKSLKPPFSTTIPVSPTDSISTIKSQIATQPRAPPADAQRLLLKGKALADAKLLKEYSVQDGDTINLMVKPGVEWDPTAAAKPQQQEEASSAPLLFVAPPPETTTLSPRPGSPPPSPGKKRGHSRIPSVVLSPTPSSPLEKPMDIQLVDGEGFTLSADVPTESATPQTTYRAAVSQPEYWEKLLTFLRFVLTTGRIACLCHPWILSTLTELPLSSRSRSEFPNRGDASIAFEDYLAASKGVLTASEIAKIRDFVGVSGMAGT